MRFQHVSEETLSGYLSGELTAREKYDADTHFTICPECAARLEEQRSFEKKITAAYNSSFPLYLSPDARRAIMDEVNAGFVVDSQAPLWQKRVMFKLFAQVASVVIVAASIALMVFTQNTQQMPAAVQTAVPAVIPDAAGAKVVIAPVKAKAQVLDNAMTVSLAQKTEMPKVDAVTAAKKENLNVSVAAKKVKIPAVAKQKTVAEVKDTVAVEKPETAVKEAAAPVSIPSANVKKVTDPLLMQNHSLVKIFHTDNIAIRKKSDRNFILQGVKVPFAEDLYVIYAASGVLADDSTRTVELSLSSVNKLEYISFHPAGQKDVCIMVFRARVLPREFGRLESVITEEREKRTNTLYLERMLVHPNFSAAPEPVRLAAILHAVSNPHLVLKRISRSQIIAELEKLLASGYAADPQIKALFEQLKKVR